MPLPALQRLEREIEKQRRLFVLKKGELGRHIDRQIAIFEEKKDALEQKFEAHIKRFEQKIEKQKRKLGTQIRRLEAKKDGARFDDVRFFGTWIEKPLTTGAVAPSSKALARTMAGYIDPDVPGPIIELGPGTGPVTEALVAQGVDPSRLVLVEFDPAFCRLLKTRFPGAMIVNGDAYSLKRLLGSLLETPAAAVVSGLPLFTKPLRMRLRLLFEAFSVMTPGAPFVQFTYNAVAPIPTRLDRVSTEASERVWMNIPPARVWVYRRTDDRRQMTDGDFSSFLSSVIQPRPPSPMAQPKILVFPGSLRAKSYNGRLAALACKELMLADADVTRISLLDYPLPIYDADMADKSGPPDNAIKLKQLMSAHQGVFIASPEYNASVTPLIKNTIDWISAVRERGEPALAAYQNRVFAIGGASPGRSGARQSLIALRQILAVGCRALVVAEQVSVPNAGDAFDDMDELRDARLAGELKIVVRKLVELAKLVAGK